MKDIEKIKSEDLGCQVADANPGNFAIEQEVGAMVGATVPAPTAPSDDDARELGAQLLVFLRRALLPIRSALRTALADIYAYLDSRCTDYTPAAYAPYQPLPSYDPMGTPPTPRTLPNLLTAITAFASRKISIGDGSTIPDGMPFARLACSPDKDIAKVLIDDSEPWAMVSILPCYGLVGLQLNCSSSVVPIAITMSALKSLSLPYLESEVTPSSFIYQCGVEGTLELPSLKTYRSTTGSSNYFLSYLPNVQKISLPDMTSAYGDAMTFLRNCESLQEVSMPKVSSLSLLNNYAITDNPELVKVKFGAYPTITYRYGANGGHDVNPAASSGIFKNCPKLIDIEIESCDRNMYLNHWNPTDKGTTFLQNFLEHICQRLANRTGQTKLTLTLSADVYTAIMTDNDIKAELVARNWKVTDGTNNYNN